MINIKGNSISKIAKLHQIYERYVIVDGCFKCGCERFTIEEYELDSYDIIRNCLIGVKITDFIEAFPLDKSDRHKYRKCKLYIDNLMNRTEVIDERDVDGFMCNCRSIRLMNNAYVTYYKNK